MIKGDTHLIGNTLYSATTHTNRDTYYDITKMPSALYDRPALQHSSNAMWGLSKVPGLTLYATHIDDSLQFGHVRDATKPGRYTSPDKALTANRRKNRPS